LEICNLDNFCESRPQITNYKLPITFLMKDKFLKNLVWIIFLLIFLGPLFGKNILPILIFAIIFYLIFTKFKKFQFGNLEFKSKNMENIIDVDKVKSVKNVKRMSLYILGAILILWLFFASIVIVEAGETGVYSLFGKVSDQELSSGFHLVIPLARVTKLSIRTEEYTMSIAQGEGKKFEADAINALTKEGLSVDLDMTVLYRLSEEQASDVYKTVGLNYEEKIIRPSIRTSIRDIIAQYEAKDIYSEKRQEAADKIFNNLKVALEQRGIVIEDVLLRNVALPANLANAIQEKLQAEQEAEKYDFILDREKKEKERKIIEAEGQKESQSIINQSLTQNYLYYLYINQLKDRQGTIYVPTNPATGMPLFRDLGK